MISVNARSIVNKVDRLEVLVYQYDPHVIMIPETWLHDDIRDYEIVPPNYILIRKDRGSRGRGVAMAIKKDFECHQLGDVPDTESVWVI